MEIPLRFKIFLFWKSMFNDRPKLSQIKISKKGKGVSSILFFLPDNSKDAKVANYLVKADRDRKSVV